MSDSLSAGLLLKLDITVWTGSAALSAPDLGLDPASIAAHFSLGRKRLVPKHALDPVASVVRQARYAVDSLSHPLPDGSRFVLDATAPEVEAELRRGQARFEAAVATFLGPTPPTGRRWPPSGRPPRQRPGRPRGRPGDAGSFVGAFLARVAAAFGVSWRGVLGVRPKSSRCGSPSTTRRLRDS